MNLLGTNSTGTVVRKGGSHVHGVRVVVPLLSGMLLLSGPCSGSIEESAPRDFIRPAWSPVSAVGRGTARAAIIKSNRYQPKTALGRRLLALRETAIAKGMRLIPAAKLVADLEEFRR
jgi:hypothetical protein